MASCQSPHELFQLLRTPTKWPEHLRQGRQSGLDIHWNNRFFGDVRPSAQLGIFSIELHGVRVHVIQQQEVAESGYVVLLQ